MTIEELIIWSLDLITISVPPALPTALSFGITFALRRYEKCFYFVHLLILFLFLK